VKKTASADKNALAVFYEISIDPHSQKRYNERIKMRGALSAVI
jgi:hypothetical protein